MPRLAARPIPATTDTGVEMTRAPGQPMTNSVKASSRSPGYQEGNAAQSDDKGVYQRAKRSMKRCVGAFFLGLFHTADDAGQGGVRADTGRLHFEQPGLVNRASKYHIPGHFLLERVRR